MILFKVIEKIFLKTRPLLISCSDLDHFVNANSTKLERRLSPRQKEKIFHEYPTM